MSLLPDQAGRMVERLRRVGELREEARTDPLTGLCNRRAFLEALDRSLGHQAGVDVLVAFAALQASVRDGDCAARYGGEEFALVLPSATSADMDTAANVVISRLRSLWDGPVTFSVGIAVRRLGDSPSTTLARADEAVYAAKAAGRNTQVVAA